MGGGILIEIFDSIYGVSRETEVIHYPKHAIVVSGVESKIISVETKTFRFQIYVGGPSVRLFG